MDRDAAVAIVGMGLRFPLADDKETFWRILREGKECIRTLTDDELLAADAPPSDLKNPNYVRRASKLDNIDLFDPEFFGFTQREARIADPQLRLLLEVAHECIEDSGHRLSGERAGIYLASADNDYWLSKLIFSDPYMRGNVLQNRVFARKDYFAMQMSYRLNLRGPSISLATTCSSGLVAVHQAVNHLLLHDCDYALAGGCEVAQGVGYMHVEGGIESPDGRCKTFDRRANGTIFGSGVGLVMLRRLDDALNDGDHIYAVIRGVGVNNDGHSKPGFTAPSADGQAEIVHETMLRAGISAEEISYVEAHGTGTPVGDPIEVEALTRVFKRFTDRRQFCGIGSVKTNVGHLSIAAGIAGLIKTALSLEQGEIPPSLHFEEPNPEIDFEGGPFFVNTALRKWESNGKPRIAGVSAFGIGGTNAHVIVQEAPPRRPTTPPRKWQLLPASGLTEEAVTAAAERLDHHLASHPDLSLADVAYTLQVGRTAYPLRRFSVRPTGAEAGDGERAVSWSAPRASRPGGLRTVFMFPGQGTQYVEMGRGLYDSEPVFRAEVDRCAELLLPHLGTDIRSVIYPGTPAPAGASERLRQTSLAQPALFVVSYALARQLMSWGVRPDAMIGHSVGEYVCACLSGVFGLEDALALIAARGERMQAAERGGMLSVTLPEEEAAAYLEDGISIAAVNGPERCVLSGPEEPLERVAATLASRGIQHARLRTSHAFHSAMMEPILAAFRERVRGVTLNEPRIPFISNVTGTYIADEVATDPEYWVAHVRQPVRFWEGIRSLGPVEDLVLVEVGPGGALTSLVREGEPEAASVPTMRQPKSTRDDEEHLLEAAGHLWSHGIEIDWDEFNRGAVRNRVPLPTYAFTRRRFWLDRASGAQQTSAPIGDVVHPLLGARWVVSGASHAYENQIGVDSPGYLQDHRIPGSAIFPGAGYIEIAAAMARRAMSGPVRIEEVLFERPLLLPDDATRRIQSVALLEEGRPARFEILVKSDSAHVNPEKAWLAYSSGRYGSAGGNEPPAVDLASLRERIADEVPVASFYDEMQFVHYGERFRSLRSLWKGSGEVLARVSGPADPAGEYTFHPALLDACFQVAGSLSDDEHPSLPARLVGVTSFRPLPRDFWVHARVVPGEPGSPDLCARITVCAEDGTPLAEIEEYHQKRVAADALPSEDGEDGLVYDLSWEEKPLSAPAGSDRAGSWLICPAVGGLAAELQRLLSAPGRRSVEIANVLDPEDSLRSSLTSWAESGRPEHRDLVVLWPVDSEAPALDLADQVLRLVQELAAIDWSVAPRLWVVTRGAQPAAGELPSSPARVAQSALWGLVSTVQAEHPEFRCTAIDLDPHRTDPAGLLDELLSSGVEPRVAFRDGRRYVLRLRALGSGADGETAARGAARPEGPTALRLSAFGTFDNLHLAPIDRTRREPGDEEVEVELAAAGLNFKECLIVLGKVEPDEVYADKVGLGLEGAGTVVRTGRSVTNLKSGDPVILWSHGCLATHITTHRQYVIRKPEALNWVQAAGIPIVFMTAYYALHDLAKIRPGDRVLIHSCAGGLGQAAAQVARAAGAEIYATASRGKWEMLRSQGITNLMDSRSLAFREELLAMTGGRGVDVVLNSLTGEAIRASFDVLAENGRFIEVGKLGIWTAEEVAAYRPDATYRTFEIVDGVGGHEEIFQYLMTAILDGFRDGRYQPLGTREFALQDAASAYRWLASGKSTGKAVVSTAATPGAAQFAPSAHPDRSHLVTGGLGALGMHVAEWLVRSGAKRIVLISRGEPTGARLERLEALRATGASVEVMSADVGSREQMAAVVERARPLSGVFHCAGALDDGVLLHQNRDRFEKVFRSKVDGTVILHELTRGDDLDAFVCFSSTSAILDGGGQANYATANAFMDGFVHYRRSLGLPGLAVNWGAWAGEGMASVLDPLRHGHFITKEQGQQALERLLVEGRTQAVVTNIKGRRSSGPVSPLLEAVAARPDAPRGGGALAERLKTAPAEQLPELLGDFLRTEVGKVLGISAEEIGLDENFVDAGIDSLMMTELRNKLQTGSGVSVRPGVLFTNPTVARLTEHLVAEILDGRGADPAEAKPERGGAIIPLGEQGRGTDLYCIPGVGGNVLDFQEFARSLSGRDSVKVLQVWNGDTEAGEVPPVDVLAGEYARLLMEANPSGPYSLVGYSFGGTVAVELAHQLVTAGKQVRSLVLIDSFPFFALAQSAASARLADILALATFVDSFGTPDGAAEPVAWIADEQADDDDAVLSSLQLYLEGLADGLQIERAKVAEVVTDYRARVSVADYRTPTTLREVPIRFLRADRGPMAHACRLGARLTGATADLTYGWQQQLNAQIEIVPVPCSHREILRDPWVGTVIETVCRP